VPLNKFSAFSYEADKARNQRTAFCFLSGAPDKTLLILQKFKMTVAGVSKGVSKK
jgi:hypothetical protein